MSRFAWPAVFLSTLLASSVPLTAQRGPTPTPTGLKADVLALACAPLAVYSRPDTPLRLTGGQDSFIRRNFAPGDLVTINAGTVNGMTVGQEFFIRRVLAPSGQWIEGTDPLIVTTVGWLRVYAVDDNLSLATVTHSCDSIEVGDYLETFKLPEVVVPSPTTAKPERDHYARVMPGSELRHSFGRGDFFTINRGASDGLKPGAQFVVYRNKGESQNFLFELGEAFAVTVGPQTSTLQVTLSRDAFMEGDYVAERK